MRNSLVRPSNQRDKPGTTCSRGRSNLGETRVDLRALLADGVFTVFGESSNWENGMSTATAIQKIREDEHVVDAVKRLKSAFADPKGGGEDGTQDWAITSLIMCVMKTTLLHAEELQSGDGDW